MFPSSVVLTSSESDIRVINTEEAHAMFSDGASPTPATSSAPQLSSGLTQTTTQDLTRCARSHAPKLTTSLLKLGKAGRVPDEAELSLMKNRFGQRASQATRFNWGNTDWVPRHIGALYSLLTPPPSPMVVSPSMSISSSNCSSVQARDSTSAGDIGPYSTALLTSSMRPHPMLRPPALFPHVQHPDTQISAVLCIKTSQGPSERREDLPLPDEGVSLPTLDATTFAQFSREVFLTQTLSSNSPRVTIWICLTGRSLSSTMNPLTTDMRNGSREPARQRLAAGGIR
ncbi:uncharacterized protein EV420DRAFT_1509903 [Desarmillaria tabescens]|uniref:Uncharacterized protein n=1 Tax=Armillaria tabescens TaxID=1929756 RepID=A0AA39NI92_ARMTA|nr:uncharacterized protein EV420DRAFT_1509903 [Desarmillaria tabescens]KAK0466119.1 hypothetical protein EV420DRAFT_1509903 [Desarmillaria tabescens]